MNTIDKHNNINAREGIDRCGCGCKYWESDRCIDCGTLIEIAKIRQYANDSRVALDIKRNVQWSTMIGYRLPWLVDAPITDLSETLAFYRGIGFIQ